MEATGQDMKQLLYGSTVDRSGFTERSEETFEDGDEIIDLGDEREQVLADMKKILESGRETEIAISIADRFISIQETDGGYDYSIIGTDYKVLEGGLYDDPNVPIRKALDDIVDDLKTAPRYNGAAGNIGENDESVQIDYDELMEKVESANRIQELLKKQAEYKPLAKVEEMEEQNFNMIDNVLNNGIEKAQREAAKSGHGQKEAKVSLIARLAEKKAKIAGQVHDTQEKDNNKYNQRVI